ncbi:MAG: hypothetical protein A2015_09245 [Spirochaetes bacterium GWF1_31_7]|nr:MAG: hypothetical protein A2Y30_08975 [Spirochaetes bacterium GWE1_32_154]OHD47673.1 MAG: hypothetical protein A2015_09245 [Spirochaetes bacterium GWF1_31_7]HBD94775.1 hypothetical protein [Spirochaetia bacterium]
MPIDEFNKIDEEYFTTTLEEDFYFEGDLKTEQSLIVKGIVKGTLQTSGLLVVGPNSTITADVRAKKLQCFGKIIGNILVEDDVYFHSPSIITGDVSAPEITLENGCILNGRVTMKK